MHATSLPVSLVLLLLLILSILIPSSSSAAVTITFDLLEESPASTLIGVLSNESKIQRLFLYAPSVAPPPRRYSFLSQDLTGHQRLFHLTEVDGQLSAREPVDREGLCPQEPDATCEIQLDVAVIHAGSLLHTVKVVVRIVDLNDHSPRFVKDVVQLTISETAPVGTEFSLPEAEDPDSGLFGVRDFGLVGDDDDPPGTNGTFRLRTQRAIDGTTELRLVLARNLDREEVERYRMRVLARDGGNPVRTGTLVVDVSVEDANDDPPRFVEPVSEVTIEENLANGTIIGVVKAVDRDLGTNGVVRYSLTRSTQHSVAGLFSVGTESGEIRVEGLVDFERRRGYTIGIVAVDGGSNPLSSHAVVTVHVTDVNDNPPRISVSPLTQSGTPEVMENAGAGTFAAHVSVTDPDTAGSGGEWNCTLTGSADKFRLERIPEVTQNEFKLVTVVAFDREAAPSHHVTLTCADHGLPAMTSSTDIDVRVLDENDEAPRFQLPVYSASVVENNHVGDFLVEVSAFDRDLAANGEISYAISRDVSSETSGVVTIDAKLGRIYANVAFDRELKDGYEFRVIASDAGFPVRSAMVNFRLAVTDVNDESPRFSHRMYTFGTYENQPGGTEVGTVTAADADGPPNDVIQYEIVGGSSMDTFRIDPVSGRIASTKSLDREDVAMYLLNVTASNPGTSLRGQTQVKVIVADRNDNTPRILFPPAAANSNSSIVQISSRARIGDVIAAVEAVDDDVGSNAALRYVITGGSDVSTGLFGVNLLTGVLTVRRDLVNHADQSFPVRFTVHDEGQPRRSASASLIVTVNSSLEVMSSSSSSSSWGQRGPVPLSTLTMIAAAAGGSCIVVIAAVILFLVLRRRRREPEVILSQPELGKMLPLAVDPPRGALIRNDNHPDVKSNLLQYDVDSKPVRSGGRTTAVDSKNKKNTNKNSKNWNKNRKNVSRSEEDELNGKQIAWLATYEDNLLQTYKQKNNKMADPCTAATSPLPSNRTLPPPPPPPPPPPAPSSTTLYPSRYLERRCPQEDGGLRDQLGPGRTDQQASLSAAGSGCPVTGGFCGRQRQQMKQSPDGCCLVAPPIDQSSDQGSVTDSGRGQSEDGEHATTLTNSLRQVRHFPLPRDRQLATHAISSPGKPVGWTTRPTCVNCRCDQADHNRPIWNRALPEQHRLVPNRPPPNAEAPSELRRLGSRPLNGSDVNGSISSGNTYIKSAPTGERTLTGTVPTGTGSVHAATGSAGHVMRNGRKAEEEDGYLSDDATTTSGSYVLDHRDGGNVWCEQQHVYSPDASRV